ncbi:MAG: AraC family transcriptional regulator [Tannerella sp.]|jgi:AraC-like DNA-binding protein|nr:AraC family transcriptional regulator [Tannerella sp.]
MKKYVKVPTNLVSGPVCQNSLVLDGCSVIDSCVHSMKGVGTMFLEEHLLLFILEGKITFYYGKQSYTVRKNEMILLKKATSVRYEKEGDADNDHIFESLMFCMKDDLIKEFLTMSNVKVPQMDEEVKTSVCAMSDCLIAFANSLHPYFKDPSSVNPGLLRLKIMELLYDVSECSKNMFRQILQLRKPIRTDIRQVVEQYYATPVTMPELAYLSGRSLSSFKRDFQLTYNMPPAQWIRIKRLEKAKEMLQKTMLPVTDICYTMGFENVSHFSRVFKDYHGYPPTQNRH